MSSFALFSSEDLKIPRHCALCQKLVPANKVERCPECEVRAYCSKECQKQDWKSKCVNEGGQGHKNWCPYFCGEQDLFFSIAAVKGKGRGLIAKRLIPYSTRIIVEGHREDIRYKKTFAKACAALQVIKFANHSCDNNAEIFHDGCYNVSILVSKRDIKPEEEITVNYLNYNENFGENRTKFGTLYSFIEARKLLKSQWGIICPRNCFCKTLGLEQKLAEAKELFGKLAYLELSDLKRLMKLCEELKGSLFCKGLILRRWILQKIKELDLLEEQFSEAGIIITMKDLKNRGFHLHLIEQQISESTKILINVLHPQNEDIKYLVNAMIKEMKLNLTCDDEEQN